MQDQATREGKSKQHYSACRAHTLLKQLTQQTPITIDGLPAFVPASRWVIDPHDNWVRYWDVVILLLLVFTSTVTPFEVSFLDPHLDDACFLADMFIQALMGFLDRRRQRWETRPRKTIRRYCKRWLVIDTLSVLPYDAVVLIPSHNKLKLLRLLRLLRLFRLVRMIRLARIFRRWESHIGISYSHLKLIRFSVAVLVCAHWLACGFFLVVVLEDSPINWVSAYSTDDAGHSNMSEPFDNYIISLYWSVMTMSTIGYGDVTPKTQYERIYEIFGMILGASVYAYMVGAICSIVASMNAASAEFNQQMDSLNTFMAESQLPPSLRARLREFFRYRRSARSLHDCPDLLQAMSPALRAQVASHTQAKWVNTVPFFRPLPEYLKTEIALALRTEAYAPNEPVVREGDKCNRLFIIDQGLLSSKGRLLGGGAIVGEQHFLLNKGRWSHSANTVTYTRLLSLEKDTFDEILDLVVEAESDALQPLQAAATVIQKHWRGFKARRTRRMMQNVVRGSIIQSRAAHYHITAAQQDVTATMLRQFAASAEYHQQALGQDYMQPYESKPASVTEELPMQCFADMPLQQPAITTATSMQFRTGLMPQISQGPHIAWADQAMQDSADQMVSSALARQMPIAGPAAELGELKGLEQPIRSGRHNVLFEAARPNQSSSQGQTSYLDAIGHYRQQMESSLEALRQEMEAFQSEMMGQFVNIGTSADAS
ncbi:TPA: hypothetical protein ACH3X3_011394 [Trebouxia sp. C0006]